MTTSFNWLLCASLLVAADPQNSKPSSSPAAADWVREAEALDLGVSLLDIALDDALATPPEDPRKVLAAWERTTAAFGEVVDRALSARRALGRTDARLALMSRHVRQLDKPDSQLEATAAPELHRLRTEWSERLRQLRDQYQAAPECDRPAIVRELQQVAECLEDVRAWDAANTAGQIPLVTPARLGQLQRRHASLVAEARQHSQALDALNAALANAGRALLRDVRQAAQLDAIDRVQPSFDELRKARVALRTASESLRAARIELATGAAPDAAPPSPHERAVLERVDSLLRAGNN